MKSIYKQPWYTYILLCADGTFYTGIAKNLQNRIEQHVTGKGAKYTQTHGAGRLVYSEIHADHRTAAVREIAIKKLSRPKKEQLIAVNKSK